MCFGQLHMVMNNYTNLMCIGNYASWNLFFARVLPI
jgi:hypothetical protein